MSKWGYSLPDATPCKRCGYPCHNNACENCGGVLCEPCFQFATRKEGYTCCESMAIRDGISNSLRVPDLPIREANGMRVGESTKGMSVTNPHLNTLVCQNKKCLNRATFGKFPEPTLYYKAEYKFCPLCGSEAKIVEYDTDRYWRTVGRTFEIPSVILKELYKDWNLSERQEFPHFLDYVRSALSSEGEDE